MLPRRIELSGLILLPILLVSFSNAEEPRPKPRVPDNGILQEKAFSQRTTRTPVDFNQPEVHLHPALFSELPLSSPRGKETPSGPKSGRYCENGFHRAGFPNLVGYFAKGTTDADHQVGYVGGGTWFGGSCRRVDEGTFGMDYVGRWFSRSTWMNWSHGARHQGGDGRYETDGPKLCPE